MAIFKTTLLTVYLIPTLVTAGLFCIGMFTPFSIEMGFHIELMLSLVVIDVSVTLLFLFIIYFYTKKFFTNLVNHLINTLEIKEYIPLPQSAIKEVNDLNYIINQITLLYFVKNKQLIDYSLKLEESKKEITALNNALAESAKLTSTSLEVLLKTKQHKNGTI